jgi:hypothetical protein
MQAGWRNENAPGTIRQVMGELLIADVTGSAGDVEELLRSVQLPSVQRLHPVRNHDQSTQRFKILRPNDGRQ